MDNVSTLPTTNRPRGALMGSKPALLMPGEYTASYYGHTTKIMFRGRPKLYLTFMVEDENRPVALQKYYNVQRLIHRNITAFEMGYKSNVYRDYVRLFGAPKNIDSFTSEAFLQAFENKMFVCDVATVSKDSNDDELPYETRYSIIDRIKRVIDA
jgi:hypothetical protein